MQQEFLARQKFSIISLPVETHLNVLLREVDRVGKNHDLKKSKKSDFFYLNQIFLFK